MNREELESFEILYFFSEVCIKEGVELLKKKKPNQKETLHICMSL